MNFTHTDWIALSPILTISVSVVLVMLVAAFFRQSRLALLLALVGLALSCAALPFSASVVPRDVTQLLVIDHYALFYMGLTFGATFIVALLCHSQFRDSNNGHGTLYVLLLLAALGGAVLVASQHFASFFLGLELLSISLFALIAYPKHHKQSIEASIKYLVLAGLSSAFLLFGMALIFAALGTMHFAQMSALAATASYSPDGYLLSGLVLILVGVGFKLAVAPFHMWTPDVYEGAPASVTAFVATVSKGAALALLLRYFVSVGAKWPEWIVLPLSIVAMLSILVGNLLALLQDNIKRILAYSSIAQLGYLLVAFIAISSLKVEAVTYYLAAYVITMLGAFGVVTLLSRDDSRDSHSLSDYRGLFWRSPWLAGAFTAMLLSLAGIPLTMGFIGKFYVIAAGVDASLWPLVITVIIGSVIGLFYYLRIITAMCMSIPEEARGSALRIEGSRPVVGNIAVAALTITVIWLGVYPLPLIEALQATVTNLR
jgi:NADH-quinone oxidoreductase subunit N